MVQAGAHQRNGPDAAELGFGPFQAMGARIFVEVGAGKGGFLSWIRFHPAELLDYVCIELQPLKRGLLEISYAAQLGRDRGSILGIVALDFCAKELCFNRVDQRACAKIRSLTRPSA